MPVGLTFIVNEFVVMEGAFFTALVEFPETVASRWQILRLGQAKVASEANDFKGQGVVGTEHALEGIQNGSQSDAAALHGHKEIVTDGQLGEEGGHMVNVVVVSYGEGGFCCCKEVIQQK